jgi:ATP/maltotriose-dependent transcriptional regulator MalT
VTRLHPVSGFTRVKNGDICDRICAGTHSDREDWVLHLSRPPGWEVVRLTVKRWRDSGWDKQEDGDEVALWRPADGVLQAKLHVPQPRADWVTRPDLVEVLERSEAARLVLIVAPAGSGKSTALALWRSDPARTHPVAVYTADERDDDPVVLWTGLLTALGEAVPGLDTGDLVDLLGHQHVDISGVVVAALADRLAHAGQPATLAIDDYHHVTSWACQEQIRSLLIALPPGCRLVLAARRVPRHLPVARMRAAGDLVEIGPAELRLSTRQMRELLGRVTGVEPPTEAVDRLMAVTEGWATGVHLAALTARGRADLDAVLSRFGGAHRDVHDYLVEQVLAELPPEHAVVLTRTSILDRFCAELCQVLGEDDWSPSEDDSPHLFLVPLDDDRRWYRFHHLFQQTLRDRLERTEPRLVPTLHQRAAVWFSQHGLVGEAIDHALAGGDTAMATDLLTRNYVVYVNTGRIATVAGWLDRLGPEAIAADAPAAICAAWVAGLTGDRGGFRRWLDVAESLGHEGPLPDGTRSVTSAVALARAVFGFDGVEDMLAAAETAVQLESDPTTPWYGLANVGLGYANYLADHPERAIAPLGVAVQNPATMPLLRVAGFAALALVAVDLRRLDQASELAATAHELAVDHGIIDVPQGSIAHAALAVVAVQQGDHRAAVAHLQRSLAARRRVPGLAPWPTLLSLVHLARLQHTLGDTAAATALLEEADDLLAGLPAERTRAHMQVEQLHQTLRAVRKPRAETEPLTERELAVLRLLPATMTRREIAGHLYVSVNTVKTQTSSIYRKLGARSRDDAIRRARTLGLIA